MINKFAIIILLISSLTFIGCSSNKTETEDPSGVAETSAVEGDEFADEEFGEGDMGESPEGGDEFAEEEFDQAEDSYQTAEEEVSDESMFSEEMAEGSEPKDVIAEEDSSGVSEELGASEEPIADIGDEEPQEVAMEEPEMSTAEVAEPMDAPMESGYGEADEAFQYSEEEPSFASTEMVPERTWVPVKKMASTPFSKNGILANTIYIARPNDDLNGISQKIYGSDRTEDLLNVNPWLANGISVGDKVYYNSPQRPSDNQRFLTYYEDIGLAPEVYYSKSGDNIRKVSMSLLGHESSWKEVWATNMDIESKGELQEGQQLRYWTGDNVKSPSQSMAATEPAPEMTEDMPSMEPDAPEPPEMASSDSSLPSPEESEELPPPPPPTMAGMEPPPPPPPGINKPKEVAPPAMAESEQDDMMMYGAIAFLLLAAVGLIIIRRKKGRPEMDFNTTTHTQIE